MECSRLAAALATCAVLAACNDQPAPCPAIDGEGNPSFQRVCDGRCTFVFGDPLNCGGCGVRCGTDRACCGTRCVDLQVGAAGSDSVDDCGACGIRCLSPATCGGGACGCPDGLTACADDIARWRWCANLQTGEAPFQSCGSCGHACGGSDVCTDGVCAPPP